MGLVVSNLNTFYGDSQALWNVNINIPDASLVALVGTNGAGKTTFLRTVVGLVGSKSGSIEFDGLELGPLSTEERVRRGIVMVPEGRRLFAGLTVYENLFIGGYARTDRDALGGDMERVLEYFPDLKGILDRLAGNLSGGQQQMCAIGRALMSKPRLLLVDEMSLGLAPVIVERLAEALIDFNRKEKVAVLIVEQDVELSLEMTEHAYVLETGRIAISGDSGELLAREDIQAAYLGV